MGASAQQRAGRPLPAAPPRPAFLFAVRQKYAEDQGGYLAATSRTTRSSRSSRCCSCSSRCSGYALEGDTDLQRRRARLGARRFPGDRRAAARTTCTRCRAASRRSWSARRRDLGRHGRVPRARERARPHLGRPVQAALEPCSARLRALVWIAVLGAVTLVGTVLGAAAGASYGPGCACRAAVSLAINLAVFLAAFRVLTSQRAPCARSCRVRSSPPSRGRSCRRSAATSSTASCATLEHLRRLRARVGLLAWLYLAAT